MHATQAWSDESASGNSPVRRQVGEREPRARPQHARELGCRGALVGKGAERALAEGAVDARVRERQRFRIATQEAHARLAGRLRGRGEVDADHVAAGLGDELPRARAGPARDVDDEVARAYA